MNKIELNKSMFFEARPTQLNFQEKKMAGSLSRNINKILKNSLPEHIFTEQKIKIVSAQAARSLVIATKDSYKRLSYQCWISHNELSALKRSMPFTPFNLTERLAGILLDCYYNKISFSNTLTLVNKFIPLEYIADLIYKYDISFCDTMWFVGKNKDPNKALKRAVPLAKRLAKEYNIPPYCGMWYVKYCKYQDAEETLKNAISLAESLAEKFKITFPKAFFFVRQHGFTKYKEAEEWLNNTILLAERLKREYGISPYYVMHYLMKHGNQDAEKTLKNAIDLIKILMEQYGVPFYISSYFVMRREEPEKELRAGICLAEKLKKRCGVSFSFAIFHVERYGLKNAEEALKNTINLAKIFEEDYDISSDDAMKVTMKHNNPRAILNRIPAVRAALNIREDFLKPVHETIIKASILKDNYLEVALNLSRKLDKLVNELKKIELPLPEAIAQLSLLHGSLLGKLLIQAFGGEAKINKAERYDELKLAYHAQFYENAKYPGVNDKPPLSEDEKTEEMIENQQRAQKIKDLLMSALPEKGPERKIQTKILLQLLSGDFDLNKLTQKLKINLKDVATNTENLISRIKSDRRIEKELMNLGFLRD